MAFEILASTTLTNASQTTISFTGIPSTYSALRLVYEFTPTSTGQLNSLQMQIRFNGLTSYNSSTNAWATVFNEANGHDTGGSTTESYRRAYTGATGYAYGVLASSWGVNYTGSYKNNGYADIFEYKSTSNNTVINSYYQMTVNGSAYYAATGSIGNCWDVGAAINSIQLQMTGSDFKQYSTFDLYGVT